MGKAMVEEEEDRIQEEMKQSIDNFCKRQMQFYQTTNGRTDRQKLKPRETEFVSYPLREDSNRMSLEWKEILMSKFL